MRSLLYTKCRGFSLAKVLESYMSAIRGRSSFVGVGLGGEGGWEGAGAAWRQYGKGGGVRGGGGGDHRL